MVTVKAETAASKASMLREERGRVPPMINLVRLMRGGLQQKVLNAGILIPRNCKSKVWLQIRTSEST
jgi:hypothetical protein